MVSFLQVLGGLTLFLFGVRMLSGGMEKIAGDKIQEWLERITSRRIKAALFGTGVTALMQSSSLMMATIIGLINPCRCLTCREFFSTLNIWLVIYCVETTL